VDRDTLAARLRTFFAVARPDIVAAWLFGSFARGTATAHSEAFADAIGARLPRS
jgi:predicted nucleotidyltransferase